MDPKDTFYFVFVVLLLHGVGALLSWNMLINANSYFVDYKLDVSNASSALVNYRTNFLSYLGIASKAPNILVQIINILATTSHGSLSIRISITLIVQILVFVFTIILAIVDSSGWPEAFFWLTMLSAVIINIANGIYQSCVYGAAAKLPMEYTNAVTIGISLSGTIVSVLMIMALAISPSPKVLAIIFFSCAVVFLFVCFGLEFYLKSNVFYVYHNEKELEPNKPGENIKDGSNPTPTGADTELSGFKLYRHVFEKIWLQLLNIIVIYFVSLSVFPALMADIKPMNEIISEKYFGPVFCFLLFNLFCTVGNVIALKVQMPGSNYIIIYSLLRLLFIPFFLFCNYQPKDINRSLSVVFGNDWIYIFGGILMSVSSGYLSSLCMMYAPQSVESKYASTAGMMAALTILLGILLGIYFSLLYPLVVQL